MKKNKLNSIILSLILISMVLGQSIQTPNFPGENENEIEPESATLYQLYLSINSTYYNLDNIRVRVYDAITEEWNWCDPHQVMLQSTTYMLKIYDKSTLQLLFMDHDDGMTHSDNYRVITIDSIKIYNDSDETIIFNTEATNENSFLEYVDAETHHLDWSHEGTESIEYMEGFTSSLLTSGTPAYNYELDYCWYANPSSTNKIYERFIDTNAIEDSTRIYEFYFFFDWDGSYQPEITFVDGFNSKQRLSLEFYQSQLYVLDGDGTVMYSPNDLGMDTGNIEGHLHNFRVEINPTSYSLWSYDTLIVDEGNSDDLARTYVGLNYFVDIDIYGSRDAVFGIYTGNSGNITIQPNSYELFGIDRTRNFDILEYNFLNGDNYTLASGEIDSTQHTLTYQLDEENFLVLSNYSPDPIIYNVWNSRLETTTRLYPTSDPDRKEWSTTATNHYDVIDDFEVISDYVYIDIPIGSSIYYDDFGFDSIYLPFDICSELEFYFYIHSVVSGFTRPYFNFQDLIPDSQLYSTTLQWSSFSYENGISGLTFDQDFIDNLEVEIRCSSDIMSATEFYLYSMYVDVTYEDYSNSLADLVYSDQVLVYPYEEIQIENYQYNNYNITDLYGNLLEEASGIENETELFYYPGAMQTIQVSIRDQNSEYLAFDEFLIFVDGVMIPYPTFTAERNTTISIDVNTLLNDTILTYSHDVTPGENYVSIPLPVLYLQNNAHEPINITITENGHYQGLYSWDLDQVHTQPEEFGYSEDSFMYLENEFQEHNKVMISEGLNTSLYNYKTQFGEAKEDVQQWNSNNYDYKKSPYIPYAQITGIKDWSSNFNCFPVIDAEITPTKANIIGHKDMAKLDWSGVSNYKKTYIENSANDASGSFEFYGVYDTGNVQFQIMDSGFSYLTKIYIYSNSIRVSYGATYEDISYDTSTGFHLRFDWDCATDLFSVWINSILEMDSYGFVTPGDELQYIALQNVVATPTIFYLDAWGNSFDSYVQNSNLQMWDFENGLNAIYSMEKTYDSHVDVLNYSTVASAGSAVRTIDENIISGSYSGYLNYQSGSVYTGITSGGAIDCYLRYISANQLRIYYGTSYTDVNPSLTYLEDNTWVLFEIQFDCMTDTMSIWINNVLVESNVAFYLETDHDYMNGIILTSSNAGCFYLDSLMLSNDDNKGLNQIPDGGFGQTFNESYRNGNFEWWQNNAINSSRLYLGNTTLQWSDTNITIWNSTEYDLIETANQLTNTWNHYQLEFDGSGVNLYRNSTLIYSDSFTLVVSQFQFMNVWNGELWIDAINHNLTNSNYIEHQNQLLNTSEDLWCWNAFPAWDSGYYGFDENLDDWNLACDTSEIVSSYNGHRNVFHIEEALGTAKLNQYVFTSYQTSGIVEFWFDELTTRGTFRVYGDATNAIQIRLNVATVQVIAGDGAGGALTPSVAISTGMNYLKATFDCVTNKQSVWVNGVLLADNLNFVADRDPTYSYGVSFGGSTTTMATNFYLDGLSFSWEENYFPGAITLENTTTSPLAMTTNYSTQVNPYSQIFTNYTEGNYLVGISDLYDNLLETQLLSEDENEIIYTPPNLEMALISLSDQRSNYLAWENYHLYLNGSALYQNTFERELGTTWNISVYDRFDQYLTSEIYTLTRDSNYINIQLTLYSLKIFNQQEGFNFVNVTRDPNYYETTEFWTEWIAPTEIIEYHLFAGYYKVNITDNENNQNVVYSYTLAGDDLLLISSVNTITNTLINIANVNSTIGNQITNVAIDITNQNSAINSSIVNVEINIANINSTLGSQLISINTAISNLDSDVETLFLFTNTSLVNLNTSMNSQFVGVNTEITNINNSISTLVIGIDNSISLLNASVNTQFTQISNDLVLMESNLNTTLFSIDSTIDILGSNITDNYILLNNTLNLIGNEINASELAILNNLMLVNNSIMESITNMLTQVYLINNSIYSAVINMGSSLEIDNNQILGNLTVVLQMNQELTDLFTETFFAEFLDWTNATIDSDYIRDQTEYVDIINKANDESLEIFFKYLDETESLFIAAQTTLSQLIPSANVTYRVKSLDTGEFLDDWAEIPADNEIDLGFYSEVVGITPEDIEMQYQDFLLWGLVAIVSLIITGGFFIKTKSDLEKKTTPKATKFKKKGVRNDGFR